MDCRHHTDEVIQTTLPGKTRSDHSANKNTSAIRASYTCQPCSSFSSCPDPASDVSRARPTVELRM